MLKTTAAAKIICAAVLLGSGAASAAELSAYAGQSIALKDLRGTIYFVPKDDAFEVVTTLDSDGHPFRVVTSLKDGQSTTLSTPGAIGEKSTVVEIKRDGQRLLVNDGQQDRRAELTPRVAHAAN
jgi:hypothetical protein